MPWNFPFWQVFRFAAPTLMAGNGAVLKHASNVPASALAIQDVFEKAGFPKGLFKTLLVGSKAVKGIIEHEKIKAVTLTGSGPAGSAVAAVAGKNIKKTVLELGGSDAYVILENADLDEAVKACVTSRLLNSGQSCIGAKRFIVVEKIYDEFLKKFKNEMKVKKMGDPMKENTDIGPMARYDLRDELHEQVTQSIEKGAKAILGGKIPRNRKGAFYPATILVNVKKGMPAYEDELFGPVASVIKVADQAEAIEVANDSTFGLGAAVFTRDRKLGEYIATRKLEAGACFVNAFVRSDPRLPFGGIKASGYGRELSKDGIHEFVNTKTVYVK
jgi:succinate-semialdehyde dehydrogenase/glutarate-semialdehyde dehydrogenase